MTRPLAAEVVKARTSRLTWGLLAGSIAYALIGTILTLVFAGRAAGGPELDADGVSTLLATASVGQLFVLVLGVTISAGEYRHGTVTRTFLAVPRRSRVLLAKLTVGGAAGLGYGVLTALVVLGVSVAGLAVRDIDISVSEVDGWAILGGAIVVTVLYAGLGVAFGALLRNQVAAILAVLGWTLIAEQLLVQLLPTIGRWLPGGAATALTGQGAAQGELLSQWAGGAVLAAYLVAFVVAAALTMRRRDVA